MVRFSFAVSIDGIVKKETKKSSKNATTTLYFSYREKLEQQQ